MPDGKSGKSQKEDRLSGRIERGRDTQREREKERKIERSIERN